ncbi:MAG TPA: hypothetical protein VF624_01060 [Tepidisphaeraceae bacterium]|jgi:hypothetical protein
MLAENTDERSRQLWSIIHLCSATCDCGAQSEYALLHEIDQQLPLGECRKH